MSKNALTVIGCALLLIICGIITCALSERNVEDETSKPLQLEIALDDEIGHETVIYDIDSEVE